jgi:hypothetical protein
MSKLKFTITTSLDGSVAGPNQSGEQPLGEGGEFWGRGNWCAAEVMRFWTI